MAFLLRRLGFYLAAFIAAATINFFLPRLMPGDPIQIMFAGAGSDLSLGKPQCAEAHLRLHRCAALASSISPI